MLIVSFNYSGGSHPGTRRTVFMRLDSANGWRGLQAGLDLDLNEWRSFNRYKATDIEVHNGTEVDLSVMPKGFDAKGLERQFQADGKLTFRDGNLLVAYEKPNAPVFARFDNGLRVSKGNKRLHVTSDSNDRFGALWVYEGCDAVRYLESKHPTAHGLLKALQWVLE